MYILYLLIRLILDGQLYLGTQHIVAKFRKFTKISERRIIINIVGFIRMFVNGFRWNEYEKFVLESHKMIIISTFLIERLLL